MSDSRDRDIELRKYSINNIVELLSFIKPNSFEIYTNTNRREFLNYITQNVALNKALEEKSFWSKIKIVLEKEVPMVLRDIYQYIYKIYLDNITPFHLKKEHN